MVFRRVFGISRPAHCDDCEALDDLQKAHEAVVRSRSREIRARLGFEARYNEEKHRNTQLVSEIGDVRKAHEESREENDRLTTTNRQLGNEIARLREMFTVRFASHEAKALAKRSRDVWRRHLQEPSGAGGRYTPEDVALAVTVARQEAEARIEKENKEAAHALQDEAALQQECTPPAGDRGGGPARAATRRTP